MRWTDLTLLGPPESPIRIRVAVQDALLVSLSRIHPSHVLRIRGGVVHMVRGYDGQAVGSSYDLVRQPPGFILVRTGHTSDGTQSLTIGILGFAPPPLRRDVGTCDRVPVMSIRMTTSSTSDLSITTATLTLTLMTTTLDRIPRRRRRGDGGVIPSRSRVSQALNTSRFHAPTTGLSPSLFPDQTDGMTGLPGPRG